jgi:FlaG/FlaF family flagellin (archaellin)
MNRTSAVTVVATAMFAALMFPQKTKLQSPPPEETLVSVDFA